MRAWKDNGTTRTYYLYDGNAPTVEMDASGNVTAINTFGVAGLISRHNGTASTGSTTYYMFDERGNVSERLDGSGSTVSVDMYTAYGTRYTTDTTGDPFGFGAQAGYYTDTETGLVLCGHRFYDPAYGRWLNTDPIGYAGGINLYAYCSNNPIMGLDPSGFQTPTPVGSGDPPNEDPTNPDHIDDGDATNTCSNDAGGSAGGGSSGGTGTGGGGGGIPTITLYRGVSNLHPGFEDSKSGVVDPPGGEATPYEHNNGATNTNYSSWTINQGVATWWAGRGDGPGILLQTEVPVSSLVLSPDLAFEGEVLLEGIQYGDVSGLVPLPADPWAPRPISRLPPGLRLRAP